MLNISHQISLITTSMKDAFFQVLNYNGGIYRFSFRDFTSNTFSTGLPENRQPNIFLVADSNHILTVIDSALYLSDTENPWLALGTFKGIVSMMHGFGNTILAEAYAANLQLYIYASSDLGKSWDTVVRFHPPENDGQIFFNYANPDKLLCQTSNALYISKDLSMTWQEIGYPFDNIDNVLVSSGNDIFVKPKNGNPFLSRDKGKSWKHTGYGVYQIGKGIENILSIEDDSGGMVSVWLFDTTNTSQWEKKSSIENLASFYPAEFLIASDESKYTYVARGSTIYRSEDNAFSWINLNAPDDGSSIYSLKASSNGVLYFGTYPIMYRSEDHGDTWTNLFLRTKL
jgi:photosystem II stability/assembly factor-like uncharacterized protein